MIVAPGQVVGKQWILPWDTSRLLSTRIPMLVASEALGFASFATSVSSPLQPGHGPHKTKGWEHRSTEYSFQALTLTCSLQDASLLMVDVDVDAAATAATATATRNRH